MDSDNFSTNANDHRDGPALNHHHNINIVSGDDGDGSIPSIGRVNQDDFVVEDITHYYDENEEDIVFGGKNNHDNNGTASRDGVVGEHLVQIGSADSISLEDEHEMYASLPAPEELRTTHTIDRFASSLHKNDNKGMNSTTGKQRSPYFKFMLLGAAFVLLLAVIVIGVSVKSKRSSSTSASTSTERNVKLTTLIAYMKTVHNVMIHTTNASQTTSHYLAAKWFAEEDDANFVLPGSGGETDTEHYRYRYLTRYILALNFFSLGGHTSWINRLEFLSAEDVCNWKGSIFNIQQFELVGIFCNDKTSFVEVLTVPSNNVTGSIPTEIGLLTTLKTIDFNFNNKIIGNMPPTLCQLTNLYGLSLMYNKISATIPACLGTTLKQLELLQLSNNLLTGSLPSSISNLTKLKRFIVDDNKLEGDPTRIFHNMKNLSMLFLNNNSFHGDIDNFFDGKHHESIRLMDVSHNKFRVKKVSEKGQLPLHLFTSKKLEILDLSFNSITGSVPHSIPVNTQLMYLGLSDNKISGVIPNSIKNLTSLTHLDLSNNNFDGTLPFAMGGLTKLQYLFLANNKHLTAGEIPEWLATNLTNLAELSLRNTNRTGTLSTHLGSLKKLILLDISENSLEGPIPHAWGKLNKMEFLLVSHNQGIVGTLPPSMNHLSSLRAGFFDGTRMNGTLNELCTLPHFKNFNETQIIADSYYVNNEDQVGLLYSNCGGINPAITCWCCTECCNASVVTGCSKPALVQLDAKWEHNFRRYSYKFQNDTQDFVLSSLSNSNGGN